MNGWMDGCQSLVQTGRHASRSESRREIRLHIPISFIFIFWPEQLFLTEQCFHGHIDKSHLPHNFHSLDFKISLILKTHPSS